MRRISAPSLFRLCCIFLISIHLAAQAETVNGHQQQIAVADTVNILLSSNPPLSNFNYEPGLYKFTVQPSYYYGSHDIFGLGEDTFKGGALAFDYTRVMTEKWGGYVSGLFFQYRSEGTFSNFITNRSLLNVRHDIYTVNPGLHYLVSTQDGHKPTFAIMGGPYFRLINFSQTYVLEGTTFNSAFPNQTIYDFDMKSNPFLTGLTVGGRLSWNVAQTFAINTFGFWQIPITKTCQPYKITSLRTDAQGNSGEGQCTDESSAGVNFKGVDNIFGQTNNISGGFNIEYVPWQLALNISAPIIRFATESITDVDTTMISLSKSFSGNSATAGSQ